MTAAATQLTWQSPQRHAASLRGEALADRGEARADRESREARAKRAAKQLSVCETYDALADRYDEVERALLWDRPVELGLIFSFARMAAQREGKVGDVGCGPGHVTSYLGQLELKATGFDFSTKMVARAAANYPSCAFRTSPLESLPVADREWAGAVSLGATWHHDAAGRRLALRELARVVKPGGALLFSWLESAPRCPADSCQRLYQWLDRAVELDIHFVSVKTALREASNAGFEVISATLREAITSHELPARRGFLLAKRL